MRRLAGLLGLALALRIFVALCLGAPRPTYSLKAPEGRFYRLTYPHFTEYILQTRQSSPEIAENVLDYIAPAATDALPMSHEDAIMAANANRETPALTLLFHRLFRTLPHSGWWAWFYFATLSDLAAGYLVGRLALLLSYNERSPLSVEENQKRRLEEIKSEEEWILPDGSPLSLAKINPLTVASLYLLNPLSIVSTACAPSSASAALASLLLLVVSFLDFSRFYHQGRPSWYLAALGISGLGIYYSLTTSTAVTALPLCLGALLTSSHSRFDRDRRKLLRIVTWTGIGISICAAGILLAILLNFVGFVGSGLGFGSFMSEEYSFFKRQLLYNADVPDAGTTWLMMIAMFEHARYAFILFLNFHLIVHSIPLTSKAHDYIRQMLPFLTLFVTIFERQVSWPNWALVIALLSIYQDVLLQFRPALVFVLIAAAGFGLQTGIFEMWLQYDISNSTIAFNTTAVPAILLMYAAVSAMVKMQAVNDTLIIPVDEPVGRISDIVERSASQVRRSPLHRSPLHRSPLQRSPLHRSPRCNNSSQSCKRSSDSAGDPSQRKISRDEGNRRRSRHSFDSPQTDSPDATGRERERRHKTRRFTEVKRLQVE